MPPGESGADGLLHGHLVDEVPDVSRMRHHRSDGVLGLWDDRTLVHPADAGRFADDVLQGIGLLQLAQVVVLHSNSHVSIPDSKSVCVCVCFSGSHLILFSSSLFIILEDVVPDIIFGVNQQLLGLPLLLSPLNPHDKQQHHACKISRNIPKPARRHPDQKVC